VGQRIVVGANPGHPKPEREVIGVVGNSKRDTLAEPDHPEFYIPFPQEPDRYMDIVVRTSVANPSGINDMIRHAVHEIDSQQFVPQLTSLTESLDKTLSQPRFDMTLLGLFAGVAMILAA